MILVLNYKIFYLFEFDFHFWFVGENYFYVNIIKIYGQITKVNVYWNFMIRDFFLGIYRGIRKDMGSGKIFSKHLEKFW